MNGMGKEKIGRFEIRGELGRGAQSVVYLAWDPQLEREVAIKTLHFGQADAARNAGLLDEARTAGRFCHPNVVPIFDAGEEGGDLYLVFERVSGRSLADILKAEGRMAVVKAATLMRQVADALGQAHAQGIIHRDLKPSNILIDERDGAPRVMDFGIAMRVSAEGQGEKVKTEGLSGTPSYMAPEYVTLQQVSAKGDVFAAGLILLELLIGRRVFDGGSVHSILYRISTEAVCLPDEPKIDPRLGKVILKACALDPAQRYPSAGELCDALTAFLSEGEAERVAGKDAIAQKDTLEFLLRRMRHKSDFPALSDSVSAINKLTSAEAESVNALSNTILKDFALTNKILKLVNSAFYRQAGGGNISTVSRAVIVLGFDAVRNIAITVLLFEHLQNKTNAKDLKESFLRANMAGLLARRSCRTSLLRRQGEEAFICALFHSLGHLLARYYFPDEIEEVQKLVEFKKLSAHAASAQVLGLSFEDLGVGIARSWGFPATIVDSMRRIPEGEVRKPNTTAEALHVVSGFSNEMCDVLMATPVAQRGAALAKLSRRFGSSLQMTDRQMQEGLESTMEELLQVASALHLNIKQSHFAKQVVGFVEGSAGGDIAGSMLDEASAATGHAPGLSMNDALAQTLLGDAPVPEVSVKDGEELSIEDVQSVLSAGIQDISNSLVDDVALNDILRIILETMYRAMGFKRVLLALRDARTGQMTGRFGLGPGVNDLVKQFRFPMQGEVQDVFLLATGKGLDIIMTDIDDPQIADKVPKWYRERIPAKTFVLFPLNIKGRPVALIYCDKDKAGSISIPEKELTLLKTLRNQALLAIKQAT